MTTFEDRRRIARLYLDSDCQRPPVGWLDQYAAAHRDAAGRWFFPAVPAYAAQGGRTIYRPLAETLDVQELLIAAGLDCTRCVHIRRSTSPMPVVVALPLRLVLCERCTRTVRTPPADEADRCDVCGSRGNVIFTPFRSTLGTAVYIGDVGNCCASQILAGAATP